MSKSVATKAAKSAPKAARKQPAAKPTPAETAALGKTANLRSKRVSKEQADTIIVVKNTATGNGTYVENGAGKNLIVLPWQDKASTRKIAVVGGSYGALVAHLATLTKPIARLANGVDARTAPQSAKAVADQKAAPAPKGKAAKAAPAKAGKNKQPSTGQVRTYSNGKRKDESRPDTFRRYMLSTIMAHKDTASAKAAHAKSGKYPTHKLDFNWAAQQGYIIIK